MLTDLLDKLDQEESAFSNAFLSLECFSLDVLLDSLSTSSLQVPLCRLLALLVQGFDEQNMIKVLGHLPNLISILRNEQAVPHLRHLFSNLSASSLILLGIRDSTQHAMILRIHAVHALALAHDPPHMCPSHLEMILECMRDPTHDDPQVQYAACHALCSLLENPAHHTAVIQSGCLPMILQAVSKSELSGKSVIQLVTGNAGLRDTLLQNESCAGDLVQVACRCYPEDGGIVNRFLEAPHLTSLSLPACLAYLTHAHHILTHTAPPSLLGGPHSYSCLQHIHRILQAHPCEPRILDAGYALIHRFVDLVMREVRLNPRAEGELRQLCPEALLCAAMEVHPNDEGVLKRSLMDFHGVRLPDALLFTCLAQDARNTCYPLIHTRILTIAQHHSAEAQVMQYACRAWRSAASQHESHAAKLQQCIPCVLAAMQHGGPCLEPACGALERILQCGPYRSSERFTQEQLGGFLTVFEETQRPAVRRSILGILCHLTDLGPNKDAESVRIALEPLRAVPRLMSALQQETQEPDSTLRPLFIELLARTTQTVSAAQLRVLEHGCLPLVASYAVSIGNYNTSLFVLAERLHASYAADLNAPPHRIAWLQFLSWAAVSSTRARAWLESLVEAPIDLASATLEEARVMYSAIRRLVPVLPDHGQRYLAQIQRAITEWPHDAMVQEHAWGALSEVYSPPKNKRNKRMVEQPSVHELCPLLVRTLQLHAESPGVCMSCYWLLERDPASAAYFSTDECLALLLRVAQTGTKAAPPACFALHWLVAHQKDTRSRLVALGLVEALASACERNPQELHRCAVLSFACLGQDAEYREALLGMGVRCGEYLGAQLLEIEKDAFDTLVGSRCLPISAIRRAMQIQAADIKSTETMHRVYAMMHNYRRDTATQQAGLELILSLYRPHQSRYIARKSAYPQVVQAMCTSPQHGAIQCLACQILPCFSWTKASTLKPLLHALRCHPKAAPYAALALAEYGTYKQVYDREFLLSSLVETLSMQHNAGSCLCVLATLSYKEKIPVSRMIQKGFLPHLQTAMQAVEKDLLSPNCDALYYGSLLVLDMKEHQEQLLREAPRAVHLACVHSYTVFRECALSRSAPEALNEVRATCPCTLCRYPTEIQSLICRSLPAAHFARLSFLSPCWKERYHTLGPGRGVFAWGYSHGVLGEATQSSPPLPQQLSLGHDLIQRIACGKRHSLALTDEGHVLAWGSNDFRQLGVSDISSSSEPVRVDGPLSTRCVVSITAGGESSFAVTDDNELFVWGGAMCLAQTQILGIQERICSVAPRVQGAFILTESGTMYLWELDNMVRPWAHGVTQLVHNPFNLSTRAVGQDGTCQFYPTFDDVPSTRTESLEPGERISLFGPWNRCLALSSTGVLRQISPSKSMIPLPDRAVWIEANHVLLANGDLYELTGRTNLDLRRIPLPPIRSPDRFHLSPGAHHALVCLY